MSALEWLGLVSQFVWLFAWVTAHLHIRHLERQLVEQRDAARAIFDVMKDRP